MRVNVQAACQPWLDFIRSIGLRFGYFLSPRPGRDPGRCERTTLCGTHPNAENGDLMLAPWLWAVASLPRKPSSEEERVDGAPADRCRGLRTPASKARS